MDLLIRCIKQIGTKVKRTLKSFNLDNSTVKEIVYEVCNKKGFFSELFTRTNKNDNDDIFLIDKIKS